MRILDKMGHEYLHLPLRDKFPTNIGRARKHQKLGFLYVLVLQVSADVEKA
jgi:hypothetical protein